MSPPTRIVGFAVLLAAIFAVAAVAGAELDPEVGEPQAGHGEQGELNAHATAGTAAAGTGLPGLAVADGGYRLVPDETTLAASREATYAFRIVDADGHTVRAFDVEHKRRMHLIVVRRDFAAFQHLHPRQRGDGSWVADVDLSAGGGYRAFADFATAGQSLTLATDVFVGGEFDPVALPDPSRHADAGDGYEVTLDARAGESRVRFALTRDGEKVRSVEPYLGADGHLVALREHDQAFLHVHPEGEPGGSGPIAFTVEYPTPGNYRLFLQFRHRGDVHTAAFTQAVAETGAAAEHGDGGH